MFNALQISTVFLVAIAMALSLAHALELPGKMRLDKKDYYAAQTIYYPGFTIGGIGEAAGTLAALVLLFLSPRASADFWLTAVAVTGLICMQAVYWIGDRAGEQFTSCYCLVRTGAGEARRFEAHAGGG